MILIDPQHTENVALAAAAFAFAQTIIPPILRVIARRKLERQRLTLDSLRADTDRVDGAYVRLERENTRLAGRLEHIERRCADLEQTLTLERDMHRQERIEHDQEREECRSSAERVVALEERLRLLLDENGNPR